MIGLDWIGAAHTWLVLPSVQMFPAVTRAVAAQTAMRALHRAHAHGTAVRVHDTDSASQVGVCVQDQQLRRRLFSVGFPWFFQLFSCYSLFFNLNISYYQRYVNFEHF
jgi:hypothetical protein